MQHLHSFFRDKSGATSIEYGLIAVTVSIVIVVSGPTIGMALKDLYAAVAAAFTGAG